MSRDSKVKLHIIQGGPKDPEPAFEVLFKDTYPRVLAYLIKISGHMELSGDICREIYTDLWEKDIQLPASAEDRLYHLFSIARNAFYHRTVREGKAPEEVERLFPAAEWKQIDFLPVSERSLEEALLKIRGGKLIRITCHKWPSQPEKKVLLRKQPLPFSLRNKISFYWQAACLLLMITAFGWVISLAYKKNRDEAALSAASQIQFHSIKAVDGNRVRVVLPDSSVVIVNGGSELSVPDVFSNGKREVFLKEGEAFFDIAKDRSRPFIVHSTNLYIQAGNTSFSVRDYKNERSAETGVSLGRIAISASAINNKTNQPQYLIAGNRLVVNKKNQSFSREQIDTASVASWTRGPVHETRGPVLETR